MRRIVTWLLIVAVVVGLISAVGYKAMEWWKERFAPKYLTATVFQDQPRYLGVARPDEETGPSRRERAVGFAWDDQPAEVLAHGDQMNIRRLQARG